MYRKLIDLPNLYNGLVRARHGYMVYNKNDIYIGRSIGKYGEFSEGEVELFRQMVLTNDEVIEVGANIGAHTLALAGMVGKHGRVTAFEPQRIVYQTLAANLALNSIEQVRCMQAAVGSAAGEVRLADVSYTHEDNYGAAELSRLHDKSGYPVPVVTLDDTVSIAPGRTLRLIKVDVEGMESEVIGGALNLIKKHQPFLYVENDRIEKSPALIKLISGLGYRMYWHLPPMYNPHNYAGDAENIHPTIVSVNMLCLPRENTMTVNGFPQVQGPDDHPMAGRPAA